MIAGLVGLVCLGAATIPATAQERLEPQALRQIELLQAEKAARTPAQKKIASSLLFALKAQRGDQLLQSLPKMRTHAELYADGTTLVDLDAAVSGELLQRIHQLGGSVVSQHPRYDAIRAYVPLHRLEQLAAEEAVGFIRPADQLMTHGNSTITEGDEAHRTDIARATFGIDGSGVGVAAMSDSVEELAAIQGTGELPATVTVLAGQSGTGTSEGTALLEIIHDIAPGSPLFFATAQGGQAQMAQNILDLHAAGADIIVDDVNYFAEGVFQDGVIAEAVEQVAALGVLYFSSAGNSGNLNDGESGVWEGAYSPTTLPAPVTAALSAHDFGGGANANTVTEDGLNDARFFTLQWADPLGAATDDYDLYLLDAALANVIAASTDTQDGDDNPFEDINSQGLDDTGNRLVVALVSGDPRFIHLNTHRGRLEFATDGQIFGHAGAENALAVAAVRVPAGGGAFTGTESVETFSSDGPRRIFFNADGSPAVAAGAQTKGVDDPPVVRQKPDVTAADGVSTTSSNFPTFFGTSASAPHAAALAALLRGLDEVYTSSVPVIRDLFNSTALDIEDPGFDRDSGAGILDAPNAIETINPIFTDGFESGNTSAWTN